MAYVKIMIHAVWATKNHYPFLQKELLNKLVSHIKENARSKQIFIDSINGAPDHMHCLLGLNAEMCIAKAIQLIKGESSNWMNKQKLTKSKFEWADEYYAVSIGKSDIARVRAYIDDQEALHRKISFSDEYDAFMNDYNKRHG